jgi:hypothetical protein
MRTPVDQGRIADAIRRILHTIYVENRQHVVQQRFGGHARISRRSKQALRGSPGRDTARRAPCRQEGRAAQGEVASVREYTPLGYL